MLFAGFDTNSQEGIKNGTKDVKLRTYVSNLVKEKSTKIRPYVPIKGNDKFESEMLLELTQSVEPNCPYKMIPNGFKVISKTLSV